MPVFLDVGLDSFIRRRSEEKAPFGSKTVGTFVMMAVSEKNASCLLTYLAPQLQYLSIKYFFTVDDRWLIYKSVCITLSE
jgi:hypothetical protein